MPEFIGLQPLFMPENRGFQAKKLTSSRISRLRNPTHNIAETAIDVGDLGTHACGQVAEQKRGDVEIGRAHV